MSEATLEIRLYANDVLVAQRIDPIFWSQIHAKILVDSLEVPKEFLVDEAA